MAAQAKLTSKGQITIPKSVRDELDLHEGDSVVFRVENSNAVISKMPNFLDLAGSVPVPDEVRGLSWEQVQDRAHRALGEEYEH